MTQFLKIVWLMMVEEWRGHSKLYSAGNFALFPVTVFLLSGAFSFVTVRYSTLGGSVLSSGLVVLGALFGLAGGSAGFYGRDAVENVLGDTNYLIYSSRTLPLDRYYILSAYIVKEIIYYGLILVMPVLTGFAVFYPSVLAAVPQMLATFLFFLTAGLLTTKIFANRRFSPGLDLPLDSITNKALVDVSRSSGGMWKLIFSLGLLTFFYWYFVLFFPAAGAFLRNPLLSFAVITGIVNLSIYNWINRFDSYEDYSFLPVKYQQLVDSKKKAYVLLAIPITTTLICLAYLFYPGNLLLALLLGYTSTMYSLVVAEKLTKLRPNIRLYQTDTFLKFLLTESLVIVPLLAASVLYQGVWIELVVFSVLVISVSALVEEHW